MRVLVVEDDAQLRTLMWRVFADVGHEVQVAGDATDAVEKLHSHRPEVVVLDLVLPGRDGWTVLRAVRTLPLPPAVVIRAHVPNARGAGWPQTGPTAQNGTAWNVSKVIWSAQRPPSLAGDAVQRSATFSFCARRAMHCMTRSSSPGPSI